MSDLDDIAAEELAKAEDYRLDRIIDLERKLAAAGVLIHHAMSLIVLKDEPTAVWYKTAVRWMKDNPEK